MSLQDDFFDAATHPQKLNDSVLAVETSVTGDYYDHIATYHYDFKMRAVIVKSRGEGGERQSSLPFSQIDPEVLQICRDKLIDLGGNPPPLPGADKTLVGKQTATLSPPR